MFAQFLLDFSQQKVRFAQVLAFSKVAKTEGEVLVALWASQGDLGPSKATISPQSPCSLIPDTKFGENPLMFPQVNKIRTDGQAHRHPTWNYNTPPPPLLRGGV